MLNRGELDGARILKPETVDLMTRNHLPEKLVPIALGPLSMANTGFGLDFAVHQDTAKGEPAGSLGEYWWGGAASTQFSRAPRERFDLRRHDAVHAGYADVRPGRRKKLYNAVLEPAAK